MNIRAESIELKTRKFRCRIYWPDGDTQPMEHSLDSDYWKRNVFLGNYLNKPKFRKRRNPQVLTNPSAVVDIGD